MATKASQQEFLATCIECIDVDVDKNVKYVRELKTLKRTDFWDVFKWLAGAYKSEGSHTDHLQKSLLIQDEKVKWLDFGCTPDPVNLQPHAGYVWLKSGYSEAIPWRKVRLTKQRNVDLTTDGLWAMPLYKSWVLVKEVAGLGKIDEICPCPH